MRALAGGFCYFFPRRPWAGFEDCGMADLRPDLRPSIDLAHRMAERGMDVRTICRECGLSRYVANLIANLDSISAKMAAEGRGVAPDDCRKPPT